MPLQSVRPISANQIGAYLGLTRPFGIINAPAATGDFFNEADYLKFNRQAVAQWNPVIGDRNANNAALTPKSALEFLGYGNYGVLQGTQGIAQVTSNQVRINTHYVFATIPGINHVISNISVTLKGSNISANYNTNESAVLDVITLKGQTTFASNNKPNSYVHTYAAGTDGGVNDFRRIVWTLNQIGTNTFYYPEEFIYDGQYFRLSTTTQFPVQVNDVTNEMIIDVLPNTGIGPGTTLAGFNASPFNCRVTVQDVTTATVTTLKQWTSIKSTDAGASGTPLVAYDFNLSTPSRNDCIVVLQSNSAKLSRLRTTLTRDRLYKVTLESKITGTLPTLDSPSNITNYNSKTIFFIYY